MGKGVTEEGDDAVAEAAIDIAFVTVKCDCADVFVTSV
jgi:hypothetical protein